MTPIHLRNIPEPLETYDHPYILEHFASWIKPERYLEIGVRDGRVLKVVSKYCIESYGVDLNFLTKEFSDNVKLFEMYSDAFFDTLDQSLLFDMVFIDGDHSKDQVYKDFINVEKRVIDDGFVFFHDSYPYSEKMLDPSLSNDCWEAVKRIKKEFIDSWEIVTLPFNPGVTIMKKMALEKQLIWKS
jgi:hypothetical protein